MSAADMIGWVATVTFVGSYFFARPATLRRVQIVGALIWALYGVVLHAAPVIVANLLVVAAAVWTGRRRADVPAAVPGPTG
jgi:hypothetical protein